MYEFVYTARIRIKANSRRDADEALKIRAKEPVDWILIRAAKID